MSQSVRLNSRARKHSLNHTFTQKNIFFERFAPKNLCISIFFCTFARNFACCANSLTDLVVFTRDRKILPSLKTCVENEQTRTQNT